MFVCLSRIASCSDQLRRLRGQHRDLSDGPRSGQLGRGYATFFGAPTVSGDSLDFDPVGFGASTTGGGVDVTDGNLAFMVKAKPGNAINNIQIAERGDTTLAGFGTDTTFTSVTMQGVLNIYEVDFAGINSIAIPIAITNFSPSGGDYGLGTDGGGGPLATASGWVGSLL